MLYWAGANAFLALMLWIMARRAANSPNPDEQMSSAIGYCLMTMFGIIAVGLFLIDAGIRIYS